MFEVIVSGDVPVKYVEMLTRSIEENGMEIRDFKVDVNKGEVRIELAEEGIEKVTVDKSKVRGDVNG